MKAKADKIAGEAEAKHKIAHAKAVADAKAKKVAEEKALTEAKKAKAIEEVKALEKAAKELDRKKHE